MRGPGPKYYIRDGSRYYTGRGKAAFGGPSGAKPGSVVEKWSHEKTEALVFESRTAADGVVVALKMGPQIRVEPF